MSGFPTPPVCDASAQGNALEFLDETNPTKTSGMGLPYGENFNRFDRFTRVSGGQTGVSVLYV